LLQLADSDLVLVRRVADRLGSAQLNWIALAPAACVSRRDNSFGFGDRMLNANWVRNRTFHCALTGPLFAIAGAAFLLSDTEVMRVNKAVVWAVVLIGTGIAFVLEWRYARRGGL